MSRLISLVYVFYLCVLTGCSSDKSSNEQNDHIWKETTETIDRAQAVEAQILEAAEKREEELKKQTQ